MRLDCVHCRWAHDLDDAIVKLDQSMPVTLAQAHADECPNGHVLAVLLRADTEAVTR